MLGDNPIFILTVFVCPHDYATLVIMFYSFCFNKVPSRAFGKTWVKSLWSCCKKTETLALTRIAAIFYWRVLLGWFFLKMINRQITQVQKFISELFEFQKYTFDTDYYRLFCFWQILFSMCSLLILMHLWLVLSGMNHREVRIQ